MHFSYFVILNTFLLVITKIKSAISIECYVCEGSVLSFPCGGNQIAQVVSASYGNQSQNCFSKDFQTTLSQYVNGFKPTPSVLIRDAVFPNLIDPCPRLLKCARVTYNCLKVSGAKYNVPDRAQFNISCPLGKVFQIVGAWYGFAAKFCYSKSFAAILSRHANGKTNYSFIVGDSMFGPDPCNGTGKYAYVSWNCIAQQNLFTVQYLLYTRMNPTEPIDITLNG
jgi:hypothetical protein